MDSNLDLVFEDVPYFVTVFEEAASGQAVQAVTTNIAFSEQCTIHVINQDAIPFPDKKPIPLLTRKQAENIVSGRLRRFPDQPSALRIKSGDSLLCRQDDRVIFQKTAKFTLSGQPQDLSGIHFQQEGSTGLLVLLIVNGEQRLVSCTVHVAISVMDHAIPVPLRLWRPSYLRLLQQITPEVVDGPLHRLREGVDLGSPRCCGTDWELDHPL